MGDEKQWHDIELSRPTTRRTKCGRVVAAFRSSRWMIDTALLLIILGLLVKDQWRKPETGEKDTNPWQFGQDLTGVGPRCKATLVTLKLPVNWDTNGVLHSLPKDHHVRTG